MQGMMNISHTIFLIITFTLISALGGSIINITPKVFSSPAGKFIVRVEAAEDVKDKKRIWARTTLSIHKFFPGKNNYSRIGEFQIEGHPLEVFIDDECERIIILDQKYELGAGNIIVVYDNKGELLKKWTLKDIFPELYTPEDGYTKLMEKFGVSSPGLKAWRENASWSWNQNVIIIQSPHNRERKEDGTYVITQSPNIHPYVLDPFKLELEIRK